MPTWQSTIPASGSGEAPPVSCTAISGRWRAAQAAPSREICEGGNAFPFPHSSLLRCRGHHRRGLLLPQEPVQEVGAVIPDFEPPAVNERLVGVVRKHRELVVDTARAQQLHKADRLREVDVAVVV